MTQHFLDGTKVGTATQQMSSERVPQQVRFHGLCDAGLLRVAFYEDPQHDPGERPSSFA